MMNTHRATYDIVKFSINGKVENVYFAEYQKKQNLVKMNAEIRLRHMRTSGYTP